MAAALVAYSLTMVGGCNGRTQQVSVHPPDKIPKTLSAWGVISLQDKQLQLGQDVTAYAVNAPLFSDYAAKLRTRWQPPGSQAVYSAEGALQMPVGSVLSKTFVYDKATNDAIDIPGSWDGTVASFTTDHSRLIETRLLIRREDGWQALPYVWSGNDAYLKITGALLQLPVNAAIDATTPEGVTPPSKLNYVVPSRNDCSACHANNHTSGALQPLGLTARQMHRPTPDGKQQQLTSWRDSGQLRNLPAVETLVALTNWNNPHAPLQDRARAYLHSNCGHCHNPTGAADTSALLLDLPVGHNHSWRQLGVCKPPVAAGRGTGGNLYSIVPGNAAASILTFRMRTVDPGARMPEVGRALVHWQGLDLISRWIDSLEGECR